MDNDKMGRLFETHQLLFPALAAAYRYFRLSVAVCNLETPFELYVVEKPEKPRFVVGNVIEILSWNFDDLWQARSQGRFGTRKNCIK